ncbi:hypothetical protein C2S51_021903 [Perilla frutescens var. frutescens]|nr:hypothetical protein C2S51_021903 [Perilla frutescens var. frutescens]
MSNENGDLEALLNLSTQDDPELKWPFIRKVYSIVAIQLAITVAVAAAVAFVQPIFNFFSNPWAGWGFYILTIIVLIVVIVLLVIFKDKDPLNFILFGIVSLCIGFILGLASTFISGVVIVEAGITIIAVVVSLIVFTFWASWRGKDFGFLGPFLLSITVTVGLYIIYQIYFPMGSIAYVICSGLIVLMLSGFMIIDTDALIELHFYHQYILVSIMLYLGIINIFSRLKTVVRIICCCSS